MLPDYLPSARVYAFFAALAVAAGHLVYQTSAPRPLRTVPEAALPAA